MNLFFARTLDNILFFTNKGRVYSRVYELPEGSRTSRGAHIANVLSLQSDETVTTMLVVPDFGQANYITLLRAGAASSAPRPVPLPTSVRSACWPWDWTMVTRSTLPS